MYVRDVAKSIEAGFRLDQERRGLLPSTIYRRGSAVRAWLRWLEGRSPWEASERDVQRFLDGRRVGSRTRYAWISNLHVFYGWAMREGLCDVDPTERILRPRLRPTLPRPISDADLLLALDQAPPRMLVWLSLMGFGGLRCAEVAGLTRDCILDGQGLLRVLGKGAKERMVPIHPEVWAALRAWGPLPRSGPLFRRPGGGQVTPAQVSREVAVYLDGLGIDATAHQFRHWCLTMVTRERGIRVAQELAGHANIATTAGYSAVLVSEVAEAVSVLSRPRVSA